MTGKKILFLTGTRADFGKLKALINAVARSPGFTTQIFVTGMHMMPEHGLTKNEVKKLGILDTFYFINQKNSDNMDDALASTIQGLSRHVHIDRPDLIVVHGDRVEALAGAIVGMLNNIRVAHIEGGEVSGTVDESIRHAVTKLVHFHFTSNEETKKRLLQLGEDERRVFVIGSPEMDLMCSPNLPKLDEVKDHYKIDFERYAILIYHPVVTSLESLLEKTNEITAAVLESNTNFIMILPNNDAGSEVVNQSLEKLKRSPRVRYFPSIRFESFLVLLKNAQFILGNSSCGVREAPFYSVPTINVGTRQEGRFVHRTILDVPEQKDAILDAISKIPSVPRTASTHFGDGRSTERFLSIITGDTLWASSIQKRFQDR